MAPGAPAFKVHDRFVDPSLNRVTHGEHTVQVEPKIMQVLVALAERPGEVVSRDELNALQADPPEWLREWSQQVGADLKDGLREAPSFIASTARGTSPWPVIMMAKSGLPQPLTQAEGMTTPSLVYFTAFMRHHVLSVLTIEV
jgi:hypothetical protein